MSRLRDDIDWDMDTVLGENPAAGSRATKRAHRHAEPEPLSATKRRPTAGERFFKGPIAHRRPQSISFKASPSAPPDSADQSPTESAHGDGYRGPLLSLGGSETSAVDTEERVLFHHTTSQWGNRSTSPANYRDMPHPGWREEKAQLQRTVRAQASRMAEVKRQADARCAEFNARLERLQLHTDALLKRKHEEFCAELELRDMEWGEAMRQKDVEVEAERRKQADEVQTAVRRAEERLTHEFSKRESEALEAVTDARAAVEAAQHKRAEAESQAEKADPKRLAALEQALADERRQRELVEAKLEKACARGMEERDLRLDQSRSGEEALAKEQERTKHLEDQLAAERKRSAWLAARTLPSGSPKRGVAAALLLAISSIAFLLFCPNSASSTAVHLFQGGSSHDGMPHDGGVEWSGCGQVA